MTRNSILASQLPISCCLAGSLGLVVAAGGELPAGPSNLQTASTLQPNENGSASRLHPVPFPDLSPFEPAVRDQLAQSAKLLEELQADPSTAPEQLSDAFGLVGQLYHAYGLLDSAEACYLNAARLSPRDFRWIYYLANLYEKAGKLDQAAETFEKALDIQPQDVAALVHLGQVHLTRNQADLAEPFFEKALQLNPATAAAAYGLGQIALSRRDYSAAVQHFERTLELSPGSNSVHYSLAMAYRSLDDLDKARSHLTQRGTVGVAVLDPLMDRLVELSTGEIVYLLRGRRAFQARRFEQAVENFLQAVEAAPDSTRARVNLGSALGSMGDVEGAMEQYRLVLTSEPDNATVHYNLGYLLKRHGRYEEAIAHLEKALEVNPGDHVAMAELGEALEQSSALDRAFDLFERAHGIDPSNEQARLGRARLLVRSRRYQEAAALLKQAHQEFPKDGRTALALARLLAAAPDPSVRDGQEALRLALLVFQAQNTIAHATTVAMALAELGKCEEAAQWQLAAVKAAREQGDETLLEDLDRVLKHLQQGPPCRPPLDVP